MALLIFRAGRDVQRAVPLALVERLEEVDRDSIESADKNPVVQYRGKLMPLVPVSDNHKMDGAKRHPVLVLTQAGQSVGLMVDEIIDIIEDEVTIDIAAAEPGVVGTAIVQNKATEILDASHYLAMVFRERLVSVQIESSGADELHRVLLIDDSPFFLNLLTPLLSSAGYRVTSVDSGDEALNLCQAGHDFDVILSDLQMPDMDGFAFAEAVRGESRWRDVPLVALSAVHTNQVDMNRGRAVGFTDCVAKFDRDALLRTVSETLANSRAAA